MEVRRRCEGQLNEAVLDVTALLLHGLSFEPLRTSNRGASCPECEGELIYQEGCFIRRACDYTKCGYFFF